MGRVVDEDSPRGTFLRGLLRLARELDLAEPEESDLQSFRTHIIDNWERIGWRMTGHAVASLRDLSDPQRAMLRVLEDSPNLLAPLGDARTEVVHTKLLAWFMSQDDPVGQACCAAFMDGVGAPGDGDVLVEAEVRVASGCRVDLRLESDTALVYVEAKIATAERASQLDDYHAALKANKRRRQAPNLVFLTATREHTSASQVTHRHITFRDILRWWLPFALMRGPTAAYLAGYLVTVARDVCGVAESRSIEHWSLAAQHATLKLLKEIEPHG